MNITGFEIDFLPVGSGKKNGDAIAIRYLDDNKYKVMVIDGGTKESGEELVEHIQKYYQTSTVDFVVNTHPDGDHASGLSVVMEKLKIKELWMHRPWLHSEKILQYFKDGRITDNSLAERLKESLGYAYALEKIAGEKQITINEPFQGKHIGPFLILSPSKKNYLDIIPDFEKSPEAKKDETSVFKNIKETVSNTLEEWGIETLSEEASTTADNESSVILYGLLNKEGILLTGDAGVIALTQAADYADTQKINLQKCQFIQIPHHGSRHNVTPAILDRIIGSKVSQVDQPTKNAYVEVAKGSKEYPRKVVVNAFTRRGVNVFATINGIICHSSNDMPKREGWQKCSPLPFYDKVED